MQGLRFYFEFLFFFSFILPSFGQNGDTSDERSIVIDLDLLRNQHQQNTTDPIPIASYNLAQIYASPNSGYFSIDTALACYNLANRAFKKLDAKARKKIAKSGISDALLRKLKVKIRDAALADVRSRNTLRAYQAFLKKFPRLPGQVQKEVIVKQNQLILNEISQLEEHKEVKLLYDTYKGDFDYYSPDLKPLLDSTVIALFFERHDPGNVLHCLYFLKEYTSLGPKIDSTLAIALLNKPYIELVENYLRPYSTTSFPKTSEAIYQHYALSGSISDLYGFAEKYPDFAQSDQFLQDMAVAKQSDYLIRSEFEDHLSSFIKRAGHTQNAFIALQMMIEKDIEAKEWESALDKVHLHQEFFRKNQQAVEDLVNILEATADDTKSEPIDSIVINSILEEYAPVMSSNGEKLYFCRRGGASNKENIFVSHRTRRGWSLPELVTGINHKDQNEAPLAISADGTTLLLFHEGVVKVSHKKRAGWTEAKQFFPTELQSMWQGGTTLSADKNVVIFAARRPDRIGLPKEENIDLYISFKDEDGNWGFPKNLGAPLNTPFEERSPFLHADMRTLYFSSSGHGGLGGLDVYKTSRVGDSWTEWTKPVNLGKSINTTQKDWGYRISTDGRYAYYSAEVEGRQEELYKVELPQQFRPEAVSTIQGKLSDLEGNPIPGFLVIENLDTNEEITTINPDPKTGEYFVTLPKGKLYSYTFISSGFYPFSGHIDLRNSTKATHKEHDIAIPKVSDLGDKEISITLNNLFFDHDKAEIKPASFPELDRLAKFLLEYGKAIEIAGHTDNVGSASYNQQLSEKRASAVKTYLVNKQASAVQINAVGYGYTQPVATNDTDEGKAKNRRVEIRFLK